MLFIRRLQGYMSLNEDNKSVPLVEGGNSAVVGVNGSSAGVGAVAVSAAPMSGVRMDLKLMFSAKVLKSKEGSIACKKGDVVSCNANDWENRGEWLLVTTQGGNSGYVMSSHVKRV